MRFQLLHQRLDMKSLNLQVNKTSRYNKLFKKISKDNLLSSKIDLTLALLSEDIHDSKLHFKKIQCKKDKNRYSVRVLNTQFRILFTMFDDYVELFCVCSHDKYDHYNNNC